MRRRRFFTLFGEPSRFFFSSEYGWRPEVLGLREDDCRHEHCTWSSQSGSRMPFNLADLRFPWRMSFQDNSSDDARRIAKRTAGKGL